MVLIPLTFFIEHWDRGEVFSFVTLTDEQLDYRTFAACARSLLASRKPWQALYDINAKEFHQQPQTANSSCLGMGVTRPALSHWTSAICSPPSWATQPEGPGNHPPSQSQERHLDAKRSSQYPLQTIISSRRFNPPHAQSRRVTAVGLIN